MKRSIIGFIVLGASIALAGCRMGPNYRRPVVTNNPATFRGITAPDIQQSAGTTPLGAQKWQTVFTDPVLQDLIAEAIKNNYDVKIAADRVLEPQDQLDITRAAQFPTLSVGGTFTASGGNSTSSGNNTSGGSSSTSNNSTGGSTTGNRQYGGITASAAWNLDFWGLYRRQTEAQRAYLRATVWAQRATYSTLVEDVATDYYELRTLDAALEVTKQTRDARQSVAARPQSWARQTRMVDRANTASDRRTRRIAVRVVGTKTGHSPR